MKLIWTGDWHIREDRPRCRIDEDWKQTQIKTLEAIKDYSLDKVLLVGGDIFHRPRTTPEMERVVLKMLNDCDDCDIMAGNHDLPYHSMEYLDKSSIGVFFHLFNNDVYPNVEMLNFGEKPSGEGDILCLHQLTFKSATDLPPNVDATTAQELLTEHKGYKWILTADYHQNFHYEANGRHVVNAGCITRQAADSKDYQPVVADIDTEKETVKFLPLPDTEPVVIDKYLREAEEKEERVEAFIEAVKKSGAVSLDFEENVRRAIIRNELSDSTKLKIQELMET